MTGEEIKSLIGVTDYYNRYEKDKKWDYVALLVGRATQAAEINEIQNISEEKTKSIGKSLYEEGMIIEGCGISYNLSTKKATSIEHYRDWSCKNRSLENLKHFNSRQRQLIEKSGERLS